MVASEEDCCDYCGAPPFWQEPGWRALEADEPRVPGLCPRCGAFVREDGKHEH